MSHGRGVPSHAIEFVIRDVRCLVPEELATPRERHKSNG
jgi:hypothetical protein